MLKHTFYRLMETKNLLLACSLLRLWPPAAAKSFRYTVGTVGIKAMYTWAPKLCKPGAHGGHQVHQVMWTNAKDEWIIFIGDTTGCFKARCQLLPARWRHTLGLFQSHFLTPLNSSKSKIEEVGAGPSWFVGARADTGTGKQSWRSLEVLGNATGTDPLAVLEQWAWWCHHALAADGSVLWNSATVCDTEVGMEVYILYNKRQWNRGF